MNRDNSIKKSSYLNVEIDISDKEEVESNNGEEKNFFLNTNPIQASNIVEKINNLNYANVINSRSSQNYLETNTVQNNLQVDFVKSLNDILTMSHSYNDLFDKISKFSLDNLNCKFMALGLLQNNTDSLDLRLKDNLESVYVDKIFLKSDMNPIIHAINSKKTNIIENCDFLGISHVKRYGAYICPLVAMDHTIGVAVFGALSTLEFPFEHLNLISNILGFILLSFKFKRQVNQNCELDSLTGLFNHTKLQENYAREIDIARITNSKLSVMMLDVGNITSINRDFGHVKGDEVIKSVADKIHENIRVADFAGRYGGDEFCVILPNTDVIAAKYLAKYIIYSLSCSTVDGVGPIKVSIGIATYPNDTNDSEKLLILAEQAMYISISKGYDNGNSSIVTSSDFDFWDDMALKSFASVLAKRHSQIGINFEEELVNRFHNQEIRSQNHLFEVVTSLAATIDAKDEYTKGHSLAVSRYSEALARAINLPQKEVERIKLGALLHDIGKIGIPESILKKQSELTQTEWEIMKQHPSIGDEKVLRPNPALHNLIPIVKYHHEHWNGKGYPEGLKGEEIPFAARIVSIADAFHALISDRPYRKGLNIDRACEILKVGAGEQWDKELVRAFIQIAPALATQK